MTERAGFSLIELLVAMVIGGVVAGVILQLVSGQGRYVELQSAREEVQQNTRAALELIGGELRTLPPEGLLMAEADSITLRAPRIWGVVCAEPSSGATTLELAVPAAGGATYGTNAGTGVVVNLGTAANPAWSTAASVSAIGAPATTCGGEPLEAGVERRTLTVAALPASGGSIPAAGDVAYLFDQVTYRTGTSAGLGGLWIQRRLGGGANQPMAGPVEEGGEGLSFAFFANGSAAPLATPIVDPAVREEVTRVMVVVESVSRRGTGSLRQSKADTAMISLRNRLRP